MWNEIVSNLANFSSAVLTGIDEDGYPFSIRCHPRIDQERQALRIQLTDNTHIQPGAAGLLCHSHDDLLWNLKSFLVTGHLQRDQNGWVFQPAKFIPGDGLSGSIGEVKMLISCRNTANRYLKKRGLPRPKIPWTDLKSLREKANRIT